MTELSPHDRDDPAQRLDSAIERLLAGTAWREIAPSDDAEAEDFEALMRVAAALRAENDRLPAAGSDD